MQGQNSRHFAIDIAKCFAALLVVSIHTHFCADINQDLYFYVNLVFCRLGVPFFAATSGYFLYNKFKNNCIESLKKHENKLLKIYAIWTLLYFLYILPGWYNMGYISVANIIGFCKSIIIYGSYFHLWYIVDVIYMLPIYFILVRKLSANICLLIGFTLWGIYAINYSYSSLMPFFIQHSFSFLNIDLAFISGPFVILPMLLLGGYIKSKERRIMQISKKKALFLLLISILALFIEASYLQTLHLSGFTRITSVILVTYCALVFTLQYKSSINLPKFIRLGQISLLIYCVHPMIALPLNNNPGVSTVMSFLLTTVASLTFALAIEAVLTFIKPYVKK